jgi:sortase A
MRLSKIIAPLALLAGGICLAKAAYIPLKGVAADILIDRAWSKSQAQKTPALPWPWIDAQPLARLSVPRLKQSEVVLDVSTGQALAFAPSHMPQTVRPGDLGLSVIAAHKNTHFAFLEHLEKDDVIEIETIDGIKTQFKVTHFEIVDKDQSGIDINAPKLNPQIALVTCYPFSRLSYGGPLRYVVYGEAV